MDRILLHLARARISWTSYWSIREKIADLREITSSENVSKLDISPKVKEKLLSIDWNEPIETLIPASMGYITHTSSLYPQGLYKLKHPPYVLFYKGDISLLKKRCIAIVGSRKASSRGKQLAFEIASDLASNGAVVISGMALGIDTAAHKGALSKGKTIGVMGSSLDIIYPASNRHLFEKIKREGLLISPFFPKTPPLRHNFPLRNGIIAALSERVIVVEAQQNSGSLITANYAFSLSIPVATFDLPAEGNRSLILKGAEVLKTTKEENFSDPILTLLEKEGPIPADLIARNLKLDISTLQAKLIQLEIEGKIRRLPGGIYEKS